MDIIEADLAAYRPHRSRAFFVVFFFQHREVVKLLFPSSPHLQSLLYLTSISVLSPDSIDVLYPLHLILSARHREMQSKRERARITYIKGAWVLGRAGQRWRINGVTEWEKERFKGFLEVPLSSVLAKWAKKKKGRICQHQSSFPQWNSMKV